MTSHHYSDLKDKKILVTGALRGIGKSIAQGLARQGVHVIFNYRGENGLERGEKLTKELRDLGGDATPLEFDVTDNTKIKSSIDDFIKEHGPITGLVNNAGISKDQIVLRLKESDIAHALDVNLKGSMLVTAALSRSFLKSKNVSVVNISSVVGLMGNAAQISYAASKAGLLGFTKSYAKELASRNIRCNAICPGFISSDMTKHLEGEVKENYLSHIPLGRFGDASEVASLASFLLSDASSYITGEVIKIDGGMYI